MARHWLRLAGETEAVREAGSAVRRLATISTTREILDTQDAKVDQRAPILESGGGLYACADRADHLAYRPGNDPHPSAFYVLTVACVLKALDTSARPPQVDERWIGPHTQIFRKVWVHGIPAGSEAERKLEREILDATARALEVDKMPRTVVGRILMEVRLENMRRKRQGSVAHHRESIQVEPNEDGNG